MTWTYNAKQHRWEAYVHGWRAIAQRAEQALTGYSRPLFWTTGPKRSHYLPC